MFLLVDQNCHSTYTFDGVQEVTLLQLRVVQNSQTSEVTPTYSIELFIVTFVDSKKKSYETNHSGLSLKIRHCSTFAKIKKATCEGSRKSHVL